MRKLKRIFLILSIVFVIVIPTLSIADVGNFESYDSDWGSDWGSDWDYDYDYDWGSDYDSYGGTYGGGVEGLTYALMLVLTILFVRLIPFETYSKIQKNNRKNNGWGRPMTNDRWSRTNINIPPRPSSGYVRNEFRSKTVGEKIRETDKFFNDEKFLSWAKTSFIKLQNAWTARDWESIRPIESESLFEQHSKQLMEYIERKQINKMDRISVNYAELVSYTTDNEKDILVVALNSSMNDYIIDEVTNKVLKGDMNRRITNTYKLTFIRKKGVLTGEGTDKVNTTNCPNCGAPTVITSSGKCEYCGSVITTGDHDWVLNGMERY